MKRTVVVDPKNYCPRPVENGNIRKNKEQEIGIQKARLGLGVYPMLYSKSERKKVNKKRQRKKGKKSI